MITEMRAIVGIGEICLLEQHLTRENSEQTDSR